MFRPVMPTERLVARRTILCHLVSRLFCHPALLSPKDPLLASTIASNVPAFNRSECALSRRHAKAHQTCLDVAVMTIPTLLKFSVRHYQIKTLFLNEARDGCYSY